jgi:hypothetical protein
MKAVLLKRGDVMREYGVSDYLMRRIQKCLSRVRIPGYKCRLYRRGDVEELVYRSRGHGPE